MDDELSLKILEASRMSMGMDVSSVDIGNVKVFASKIVSLSDYRSARFALRHMNVARMQQLVVE